MPTSAVRRRKIDTGGPWGTGLMLLGVALCVQGINYLLTPRHELNDALAWIDQAVPVSGWALLWIAGGIWSILRGFGPPQRHIDLIPAVGVICLWSGVYGVYWLISGLEDGMWTRSWANSVAWLGLAAVLISFGRCVNPPRRVEQ